MTEEDDTELDFPDWWKERWLGALPRKSGLMLQLLANSAAHDNLLWFSINQWRRLWAYESEPAPP